MMHPRNRYYKNPAKFGELAKKYPKFREHLMGTSTGYTINFKDPKVLRELTVSLLHHDFGLDVELPLDRLIPTVTLRLNYIHWIEDLIQMLPKTVLNKVLGQTAGIDIGTGASCIYPLLGAKINGWKFYASEVDELSFGFACKNVKRNKLEENIHDVVLADLLTTGKNYDFSMCNPPFFADKSEAAGNISRTGCRPQPSSVCTGTETETVTSGGEVAFVGRMIEDSLKLKSRVKWYTTMLGKKSSMTSVVAKLKQNNITNIVTTEFCQGRTMRWGVAWTFLADVVIQSPPKKKRKNKPLKFLFSPMSLCSEESLSDVKNTDQLISRISETFKDILSDLQIQILSERTETTGDAKINKLNCTAKHNTWANQRKKRREAAKRLETTKQSTSNNDATIVSLENKTETGNTVLKLSHLGTIQELDEGAGQSNISSVNHTSENFHSKLPLLSALKSANEELIIVQDSSDVISPCDGACMTELRVQTTLKFPTTQENKTQNEEMLKSDDKHTESSAKLENIFVSHIDKKRKEPASPNAVEHSHKLFKSDNFSKNDEIFLEFVLSLGVKKTDVMLHNEMFLQMEWIDGQNKNCMYQLFQYFQNRLNS